MSAKKIFEISYDILTFIVISTILSGSALAYYKNEPIVVGNSEDLTKTVNAIAPYTPTLLEKTDAFNKNESTFINKPEITATKTRSEIDAEQKAEAARQLAQSKRAVITRSQSQTRTNASSTAQTAKVQSARTINTYWYGFCTWYAAERRPDIPNNWGNAKAWLNSANNSGWQTGSIPKPGAVIVTNESWAGHVGFVESVDGDNFTISEMNFRGWAKVTSRTLNINDSVIRGFIY